MTVSMFQSSLLLALLLPMVVMAFVPEGMPRQRQTSCSKLQMVWSMPSSPFSMPSPPNLDSLNWYTTEKCVTRRRTIYDDEPLEYKFATPRDDWFANNTVETSAASSASGVLTVNRRRRNPIRRAVQFLKNKRSNGRSQA